MVSAKDQWQAWRDDYRATRPAVTCEGCGTHYESGQDEGNAVYIGYSLKSCGECQRKTAHRNASLQAHIQAHQAIHPARGLRTIHRDIACRYISLFDGSTFAVQTDADDADIYLRNVFGLTIAKVLSTDRYPKPVEVFDLPF